MMKSRSGVIINVSSGAVKIGFHNISAYCASKFGMIWTNRKFSMGSRGDEYTSHGHISRGSKYQNAGRFR